MDAHKLLTELRIKAGRGGPPCADMDDVELMYEYFTTERAKDREAMRALVDESNRAIENRECPKWLSYILVEFVDALAKRLEE